MNFEFKAISKSNREMAHILFLIVLHQLLGRVCCRIWVTQPENGVNAVVGRNITLSCQIHSDTRDEILQCRALWYVKELTKWREVGDLLLLRARFLKAYNGTTTNTTLTITELTLNDTNTYYCTLMCQINRSRKQYHGNGTKVNVQDHQFLGSSIPSTSLSALPDAESDNATEDGLLLVPFFFLLSLKLVIAIAIGTFSFMCRHSQRINYKKK
ncbi:hypothetical protein AAFF_G00233050 [Aldrovandia affinis]|uniref:Ig-like domain-containing protein n=1 Tax=Aldrovandia affinis TaxID=143900 RepID=A0AAD7RF53_9TELE|nr:hypothetical protein AAFF_G00233050 [Aldrovandia affinis]